MLHPKLMHILGSFAFQNFFCRLKSEPTMAKSHFKNKMENPFFKCHFLRQNVPINKNSNYIRLYLKKKKVLGINFRPLEVTQPENFHRSKIYSETNQVLYNHYSKFFWSVSSKKLAFIKMDFFVFSKHDWTGVGSLLWQNLFLKKPNTLNLPMFWW